MKKIIACLLLSGCAVMAGAQAAERHDSIDWRAQIGATLSAGEHTPLWLNAGRFGFSSLERNNMWLRVSAFKHMDENKRFSWGAGIDMGVAHRFQSTFQPQQLYAELRYRCLDALIGAKEIDDGFVPADLSSGALTQSNNAKPIPQIRIGIFDYADFWGCNGWFAIKGHIAYGMYTDDWWIKRWANPEYNYTLGTLYCSRAIYFRGGDSRQFPLEGELGLVMDSQFGGKTWIASGDGSGHWDKHPSSLTAWLRALVPMHGGADTNMGEQVNVEGNFLGNWSLSLRWKDPAGWSVRAYYQHFFEDHSMLFFDYPWIDGLFGLQGVLPKNPVVSEIVYEFLYSKDQAGPIYWDHTDEINYQVSARDGYYNNYIYNGWQNWGQAIGNPLFTSPIYNANHQMDFLSTRLQAHHLGFKGEPTKQLGYRVMLSHTRSWGIYDQPFESPKNDFSWLAEVKWHPAKLKGFEGSFSLAGDHGSLIGNSFGGMLTLSYTGKIHF